MDEHPAIPDDDKATLAELAASEERLAAAQALAHMGSYDWDIANDTNRWSDELYRIYGTEPQSFNASYERFLSFVRPDDRERIMAIHQRAMETHEPYQMEEHIVRPDGTERILLTTGEVIADESGTPIRMRGICWDVTDRRRTEAIALRVHDMEARRAQAFEINDNILQGLTTALYALDSGDDAIARDVVVRTLEAAREMVSELLADIPGQRMEPGELVREQAPPKMLGADVVQQEPAAGDGTGGLRLLLVDDAEDIRTILRLNLELAGAVVIGEAGEGGQAVELAQSLRPDVVLLDLAMPGMDGLEALPLLRSAAPDTHIVVLSGFDSAQMADAAIERGASAYLQKGTSVAHVVAVLADLCPAAEWRTSQPA